MSSNPGKKGPLGRSGPGERRKPGTETIYLFFFLPFFFAAISILLSLQMRDQGVRPPHLVAERVDAPICSSEGPLCQVKSLACGHFPKLRPPFRGQSTQPIDLHPGNSYHGNVKVTVSQKGQTTIPKPLRLRLGIRPHKVLEVHEEGDRLVLDKCESRDALDEVFGILKLRYSTDKLVAELRGRKR